VTLRERERPKWTPVVLPMGPTATGAVDVRPRATLPDWTDRGRRTGLAPRPDCDDVLLNPLRIIGE
jgi:hypothetical protein